MKSCPQSPRQPLSCDPLNRLPCQSLHPYPTTPTTTLLGGICLPTDDLLRNRIFKNGKLDSYWGLLEGVQFLKEALLVSVLIGAIWLVVVQLCTRVAVWVAVIGAMVVLFVMGVVPLLDKDLQVDAATKGVMVAVPLILMGFLGGTICVYRSQIQLTEVFLLQSAKFLRESLPVFLFIIPMILLTLVLLLITTLQHYAFKSMT